MKSIKETAMLANLTISHWGSSKVDREATRKTLDDAGAENDAGRFTKRLVAKEDLRDLAVNASQLRSRHYYYTLPWLDDGARILPAKLYDDYMKEISRLKNERESLVREFVSRHQELKTKAKRRLGRLFKEEDFPTSDDLRHEFDVRVIMLPMPDVDDFRVALPSADVRQMKAQLQEHLERQQASSVKAAYERIVKVLSRFQERLADPNAKFKNSLVTNIQELCELLPAFNITNDKELTGITETLLKQFANKDPDSLRNNAQVRVRVARRAKSVLNDIDAKLGL